MAHRLYVPLDVDFASDDKFLAAGHTAAYMYIASLALAKRTLSDGYIQTIQLPLLSLGLPGKPAVHAQRLVEVGLWNKTRTGWYIAAWAKHNKPRSEIEAVSEQKRLASLKGNHERWHSESGQRSPSCPFCDPIRIPNGSQPASDSDPSATPQAKPEP